MPGTQHPRRGPVTGKQATPPHPQGLWANTLLLRPTPHSVCFVVYGKGKYLKLERARSSSRGFRNLDRATRGLLFSSDKPVLVHTRRTSASLTPLWPHGGHLYIERVQSLLPRLLPGLTVRVGSGIYNMVRDPAMEK